MRRLPGMWGQQLAPALPAPRSLVMLPLAGGNPYKRLEIARSPSNLNASAESSTIATPWFSLTFSQFKRDNIFATSWRQLAGPVGAVEIGADLRTRFVHDVGAEGSYPIAWECEVSDKYGRLDWRQVAFTLARTAPPLPPLTAVGYPSATQFVPIDPVTRKATVNFYVTVTSAVYPVSFDWGGGTDRFSAHNSTTIELPVGATEGITFTAGCTVRDDAGRSIVVPAGPFFIYEP